MTAFCTFVAIVSGFTMSDIFAILDTTWHFVANRTFLTYFGIAVFTLIGVIAATMAVNDHNRNS